MTVWIRLNAVDNIRCVSTYDVDCRDAEGRRYTVLSNYTMGKTFTISGKRSYVERVLLSLRRNTKFELLGESA